MGQQGHFCLLVWHYEQRILKWPWIFTWKWAWVCQGHSTYSFIVYNNNFAVWFSISSCIARNVGTCVRKLKHYCLYAYTRVLVFVVFLFGRSFLNNQLIDLIFQANVINLRKSWCFASLWFGNTPRFIRWIWVLNESVWEILESFLFCWFASPSCYKGFMQNQKQMRKLHT